MSAIIVILLQARFWNRLARMRISCFNQDLYDNNGNIPTYDKLGIVAHCANTDEIAAYIGCDAQTVADSFAAWNTACENKNDPEFASEYDWERNITTSGPWYD